MQDDDAETRMDQLVVGENFLDGLSTSSFILLKQRATSLSRFDAAAERGQTAAEKQVYHAWQIGRWQQLVDEFLAQSGLGDAEVGRLSKTLRCEPGVGARIFVHEPDLQSVSTNASARLHSANKLAAPKDALAEDWARRHLTIMEADHTPAKYRSPPE